MQIQNKHNISHFLDFFPGNLSSCVVVTTQRQFPPPISLKHPKKKKKEEGRGVTNPTSSSSRWQRLITSLSSREEKNRTERKKAVSRNAQKENFLLFLSSLLLVKVASAEKYLSSVRFSCLAAIFLPFPRKKKGERKGRGAIMTFSTSRVSFSFSFFGGNPGVWGKGGKVCLLACCLKDGERKQVCGENKCVRVVLLAEPSFFPLGYLRIAIVHGHISYITHVAFRHI